MGGIRTVCVRKNRLILKTFWLDELTGILSQEAVVYMTILAYRLYPTEY